MRSLEIARQSQPRELAALLRREVMAVGGAQVRLARSAGSTAQYRLIVTECSVIGAGRFARGAKERANGDAIAFLRADHRQLMSTLADLRKSRAAVRRRAQAQRLCSALRIHLLLEEELFYPAYLVATGNERVHHVAKVEHALLRSLIDKLEKTLVEDAYFPALVQVLTAVLTRHVETKEQRRGMFAEARRSTLELLELGENLRQRHQTLREKH